jgi:Xaa-Pro aminopeptidase
MHKLPAEIAVLRRAAALADDAYEAFRQAARPGRRQYELVADIEAYLRSRGCPDNFMIIGSGGKDVLGMTPPSERALAAGDLVTTELTPAVEGYFVQICRTLVVGEANAAQRRAFGVFREALEAGIAAVKPGVTAADLARAENDVFRTGSANTPPAMDGCAGTARFVLRFKPHLLEDVDMPLCPAWR